MGNIPFKRAIRISSLFIIGLGVLANFLTPGRAAAQQGSPQARVDAQLQAELAGGGSADFVIELSEQADLSAAYSISDWNARGQYVVDTLKATAEHSQKNAIGQLKRQGANFTSYFAYNMIVVQGGNQRVLDAVASLPEVARVRPPIVVRLEPVEETLQRAVSLSIPAALSGVSPTWGLVDTEAMRFWSAYKRQGQGITVANIDTGVQYNHPALAGAYKCAGGNAGDAKCWKDVTNSCTTTPCDTQGHGTHTMGTMVGSDTLLGGPAVGMAPKANWIACRAFVGTTATDAALLNCAQWILAPGGDPANRPNVVNNSWGDSASDSWFLGSVNAWRAAGIFPVFSAGNLDGKTGCVKMGSPADYSQSFTVGAHDINRLIANFSLNGSDGINLTLPTKPNVSAPGVSVYSTYPTNSYATLSGTSMSAPHASGAVALLWSCNPALIGQIDTTINLLQQSANTPPAGNCGAPASGGGNYTYGYGYLDVYVAGIGSCQVWRDLYLPLIVR